MFVAVVVPSLFCGGVAFALKPAVHRSISLTACQEAGLSYDFCRRVGAADYDTDANEWDDLSAHAQIDRDQSACEAADRTATRLASLGSEARDALDSLAGSSSLKDADRLAIALGRALHTLQDDCAHHGMPNPQHAWASLSDFCQGTSESPDIQPGALDCATSETEAVFSTFAELLDARGVSREVFSGLCAIDLDGDGAGGFDPCRLYLPAPWDACAFLGEADEWDGIDRQWDNARVLPALDAAFVSALRSGQSAPELCGGDPLALAPSDPAPVSDVSDVPSCFSAHLLCLGKADSTEAAEANAAFFGEAAPKATTGGCQLAGPASGGSAAPLLLILFALVGAGARRRD
jgi:hypothetical protein